MSKGKKHVIKLLLWIVLAIVVIIIAGYFIYNYIRLKDKGMRQDYFAGKTYISEDSTTKLKFSDTAQYVVLTTSAETVVLKVTKYNQDIFTLEGGEATFNYIALNEQTLYGGSGEYMYFIWSQENEISV